MTTLEYIWNWIRTVRRVTLLKWNVLWRVQSAIFSLFPNWFDNHFVMHTFCSEFYSTSVTGDFLHWNPDVFSTRAFFFVLWTFFIEKNFQITSAHSTEILSPQWFLRCVLFQLFGNELCTDVFVCNHLYLRLKIFVLTINSYAILFPTGHGIFVFFSTHEVMTVSCICCTKKQCFESPSLDGCEVLRAFIENFRQQSCFVFVLCTCDTQQVLCFSSGRLETHCSGTINA